MKLLILSPSTLASFTEALRFGFHQNGVEALENQIGLESQSPINFGNVANFALIQIHGSPAAKTEDENNLNRARELSCTIVYLIHRPDEALLNPILLNYFKQNLDSKFIFLGDLIFRDPFWSARRHQSLVLPHPCFDNSLPLPSRKFIVGAFTSWGEMRDPEHFFALAKCLAKHEATLPARHLSESLNSDLRDNSPKSNNPQVESFFEFAIGGTGLDHTLIPPFIRRRLDPFVPHFNVQLYHLHGKKRQGESSGSLHRGISIPVIFEANGAERLEGFQAIKIVADEELQTIDFDQAAREIVKLASGGIDDILIHHLKLASANHFGAFAQSVLDFLQNASTRSELIF